jgi:hypothetical protein
MTLNPNKPPPLHRFTVARRIGAAVLFANLYACQIAAASAAKGAKPVTIDESAVADPGQQTIVQWLDPVRIVKPEEFVDLADFSALADGARVQQNSEFWSGKFLTPAASPYRQTQPVRRSIHHSTPQTVDVLQHRYEVAGIHLLVQESANVFLVTIDHPLNEFLAEDEAAKQADIVKIAGVLINMSGTMTAQNLREAPYRWVFRFPPGLVEGSHFSTDPTVDPLMMWSWASRVDGGIYHNRLYFLGFKQKEATSGKIGFPDGQHWFDGKCWKALQR